jgi:hypothetical protein
MKINATIDSVLEVKASGSIQNIKEELLIPDKNMDINQILNEQKEKETKN